MKNWFTGLFNNLKAWLERQVKDDESKRRATCAVVCWIMLLILIPSIFTVWLGIRLSFSMAIWAGVMSFSIQPFMVSVPEYAALVTINLLKHGGVADKEKTEAKKRESPLKEYQTGLSFRYPWEQVKIGNYINLRLLPLGMEESYPAMDGPEMHTKWQAPYRVKYPIKFIGVGREAVEDILRKAGSSVLSAFIAGKEAEEAKKEQEGMEGLLKDKFASMKLEEECGVEIPVVSLADLDYEPEVQKVRASQYVARKLKQIARELQAKGEGEGKPISDSDALTNAMIIHGKANLNVNEVKGKGGNALAALLMGMAQGSGGKNKEGGNKK